jgi:hypothetical protein
MTACLAPLGALPVAAALPSIPANAMGAPLGGAARVSPGLPQIVPGAGYPQDAARTATMVDLSAPLERDSATGLYGVAPEQLQTIGAVLRRHYGESLLDLAAIGSRVKGKASATKSFRPPTGRSDLDLAPLLRDTQGRYPDSAAIEREIRVAANIQVQLHGVLSSGELEYGDAVPFYGGGSETRERFAAGEAMRLPLPAALP